MDSATQGTTPLRRRMIDDMRMRNLADKTQSHYIRAVRQLAGFLGRSPDTASVEDLRAYQLHLVDYGTSPVSLNAAITGLKFFFEVTLDQGELMAKMQPVYVPRTLPVVSATGSLAEFCNLKLGVGTVRESVPHGPAQYCTMLHNARNGRPQLVFNYMHLKRQVRTTNQGSWVRILPGAPEFILRSTGQGRSP